ncbi:MAG: hypothetical protein ACLGH8_11400 [Bacteroidia bacterium]
MDINIEKIELAKRILATNNSTLIEKVSRIINEEDDLTEAQKTAINEALEEVAQGKTIPHDVVMEETKKRYPQYFK